MTKLTLLFLLWLPQAVYQLVTWTYWLQIKEYRYDRFWVFIKSSDGRNSLNLISVVLKVAAIILAVYSPSILILILIYLDISFAVSVLKREIRIPVITQRVKRIWVVSFLGLILAYILLHHFDLLALLIGEGFLLLTPFLGVLITAPLVIKAMEKEYGEAQAILNKYKPKVIAITGSYGKTTTKDFIYQLMSTKYKCLPTLKNQNTHFGILRRINSDLKKEHKYFIAEIGAYKRGEIREIAKLLKPSVGIITGIEPQHLELFGSFANLKEAKFELVEELESGGYAFFNMSDENMSDLYEKAKSCKNLNISTYGVTKEENYNASSIVLNITPEGIVFKIKVRGEGKEIQTNILSGELIENLTGAILVARLFKVPWPMIIARCKKLKLPESTLNVFKAKGVTVIDDSYNSSPSGFLAALDTLNLVKGNMKYVVTTGVIELGHESFKVHKRIGNYLEKYSDIVLLRNKEFKKPILAGMRNKNKLEVITNPRRMVEFLRNNVKKGDVILIEGKNPLVLKHFKDQ